VVLNQKEIIINENTIESFLIPTTEDYFKVDVKGCINGTGLLTTQEFHELLRDPNVGDRKFHPGHLTTSSLILHPEEPKVLLIHHKKYNEWLYPGGHADKDPFLLRSAFRECLEETGIKEVRLIPSLKGSYLPQFFQVFPIPALKDEGTHYHFDSVYLFQATNLKDVSSLSHEIKGIAWFDLEDFRIQYEEQEVFKNGISLDTCALCLKGYQLYTSYKNSLNSLL
jgi:8-oxo-dGTP pyrophosphatase MutT (NUDIX family)